MNNNIRNYATAFLGQMVKIKIDRPLGSKHPKHDMSDEEILGLINFQEKWFKSEIIR